MVPCGPLLGATGGVRGDASVQTGGLKQCFKGDDRVSSERCIVTQKLKKTSVTSLPKLFTVT